MTEMIKNLEWRYATKTFDATKKIQDADLNELLEATRLSPSSFGCHTASGFTTASTKQEKSNTSC